MEVSADRTFHIKIFQTFQEGVNFRGKGCFFKLSFSAFQSPNKVIKCDVIDFRLLHILSEGGGGAF